jgi:F420-dependent oxidoreductase-like protein
VKIGIPVTDFSWPVPTDQIGPTVSRIARTADEAGFDSLWTMDHFFQIPISGLPPESPMPEAYATLAFMAGLTRRIQLGTLVTSVSYRHPGVLVKTVTSLDVLSGGRVVFGVGAGAPFNALPPGRDPRDTEAYGLGIPFPSLADRFTRLEEVLQIAHQMWRGDESPFEGREYQLPRPLNSPNALQKPHPPVMVGGGGEKKTLRFVARYGDMCNLFDIPGAAPEQGVAHKLRVLREHCEAEGRDYAEIEKTVTSFFQLAPDREAGLRNLVDHLRELAQAGVDHAIVSPRGPYDDATLEALASVLPEIHAIETRSGSGAAAR